mgnify:CR=1 FL=1
MRILFASLNPLGSQGTNAHYSFPQEFSRTDEVLAACPPPPGNARIVRNAFDFAVASISPSGFRVALDVLAVARRFRPQAVHIFHSPHTTGMLALLRTLTPRPVFGVDLRSPLLKQGFAGFRRRVMDHLTPRLCQVLFAPHLDVPGTYFSTGRTPVVEAPIGVDTGAFVPRGEVAAKPRRFVFTGSIHPKRRLDVLVRGFALALARDPGLTLDIVGKGPDLEPLRSLARQSGAAHAIAFPGLMAQDALFAALPGFDAGIGYVPGGVYENAPSLKVLEYAAAGIPVLASDTAGHRSFLEHGMDMEFFANTPEDIARALTADFGRERLAAMVAASLEGVRYYDWGHIVSAMVRPAYLRLLDGNGGPA